VELPVVVMPYAGKRIATGYPAVVVGETAIVEVEYDASDEILTGKKFFPPSLLPSTKISMKFLSPNPLPRGEYRMSKFKFCMYAEDIIVRVSSKSAVMVDEFVGVPIASPDTRSRVEEPDGRRFFPMYVHERTASNNPMMTNMMPFCVFIGKTMCYSRRRGISTAVKHRDYSFGGAMNCALNDASSRR
jgi:hypothetical protein